MATRIEARKFTRKGYALPLDRGVRELAAERDGVDGRTFSRRRSAASSVRSVSPSAIAGERVARGDLDPGAASLTKTRAAASWNAAAA